MVKPAGRLGTMIEARPSLSPTVPRAVAPLKKVTEPVGIPTLGEVTLALRVTLLP